MPNMTTDEAARRWVKFRDTLPHPTREQLEVTVRLMRHFGNLERDGYEDYVSINERDMRNKFGR